MNVGAVLEQAKKFHYELWDWLLKHPCNMKGMWPGWATNGGDVPLIDDLCMACEVAGHRRQIWARENCCSRVMKNVCDFCPIGDCNDEGLWATWISLTMKSDGNIMRLSQEEVAKLAECATALRDKEWNEETAPQKD